MSYSHHKHNGLRHYLKNKAEAADAASACQLQGEQNPLADLVAVFDIEKMQDMLSKVSPLRAHGVNKKQGKSAVGFML
jgi:hypothetical protein